MGKKFIESPRFPVDVVNIASAREKGPGRPPFWEMVFWWTRKPLAAARAVILASVLPEDYPVDKFLRIVYPSYTGRRDKPFTKTPHYLNPDLGRLEREYVERLKNIALLDPFAGFGSIPLEALRLGVGRVVAVELLPSAVVFLRAILEYPARYGEKLVKDVEKWGKYVVEKLRSDPDIVELYDSDTAVYIGTWEVKCPYCGKYTPLIGNWWLARVKDKHGYKALAWMTPVKNNDRIDIEVIDLANKPEELLKAKPLTRGGKTVGVETPYNKYYVGDPKLNGEPNINARKQEAICLHCYARIKGTREKWYVKEAIKQWNTNLEKYLEGETTLEELLNSPARPRLLVKVKIKDKQLTFQPATSEDQEKLWKAIEKLKQIWKDPDIPKEPIPPYGNIGGGLRFPVTMIKKWYQLFNPRQLLTLVKLVKIIREIGKKIEEQHTSELNTNEVGKNIESIYTYLAIALCRRTQVSNIINCWAPTMWSKSKVAPAIQSFRGIGIQWNWVDVNPIIDFPMTWKGVLNLIQKGLSYLISLNTIIQDNPEVLISDTTSLNNLGNRKFDIIVTDPPYRDDVAYAELSDFYFVWLKRVLSDNDGSRLLPRFHSDCFFEDGVEISTQWEWFASREVSLSTGRCRYFELGRDDRECEEVYRRMLGESFKAMADRLRGDGLLVTFFAQSSPSAWASLIYAGLEAGLYITNAFPVITESEESVVARGKAAITSSIVVVWRKRRSELGVLDLSVERDRLVDMVSRFIEKTEEIWEKSLEPRLKGVAVYVMSYAYALSLLMKHGRVIDGGKTLTPNELTHRASLIVAQAYARGSGARLASEESIFYYIVKHVFPRGESGRRLASSSDLILLSYGLGTASYDEKQYARILDQFTRAGILKPYGKEKEAEVASRKTYLLIEPVEDSEPALVETLRISRVDPLKIDTIKNPVHCLHVLMLYSLRPREVFKKKYEEIYSRKPSLVSEAVELAKALSRLRKDPEARLASRVIEYLGFKPSSSRRGTLDEYFGS